ncbi:MAG: hypothetical protein QXL96_01970 [Ignisphaera sp.]
MVNKIRSIVSAGLSGFFAPYITSDLRNTGAIGGGLGIADAIVVEVSIDFNYGNGLAVINRINDYYVESCLAKYIAKRLYTLAGIGNGKVYIDQKISVPIGGGYGTSGGSALAITFALAKALNIPVDFNNLAEIAHEADIVCGSGLGTVVGILKPCNGIVLVSKPGGPGVAEVKCIPVGPSLLALTAFYRSIPKNSVLGNPRDLEKVKAIGLETLRKIEANPTPENFIANCYMFALETGLLTPKIKQVIELTQNIEGVLGVSMNMIGEAIFVLVKDYVIDKTLEIIKKTNPVWVHVWKPSVKPIYVEEL